MKQACFLITLLAISAAGIGSPLQAAVINFDDQGLSGPSFFQTSSDAQTLNIATEAGNVRFEGGLILNNAARVLANQTATYGTANNLETVGILNNPTRKNPLTINFENPIENFFLDIFNGIPVSGVEYTLADEIGNISTFALASNAVEGFQRIGFKTVGQQITITSNVAPVATPLFTAESFNFFMDNVSFNALLPDDLLTPINTVIVSQGGETTGNGTTGNGTTGGGTTGGGTTGGGSGEPVSVPEPSSLFSILALGTLGLAHKSKQTP